MRFVNYQYVWRRNLELSATGTVIEFGFEDWLIGFDDDFAEGDRGRQYGLEQDSVK